MIRLSPRYAPVVGLIAALAAVPVWVHAWSAPRWETCPGIESFLVAPEIGEATMLRHVPRKPGQAVPEHFDGEIPPSAGIEYLRVTVLRGYETEDFHGMSLFRDFSGKLFMQIPETIEEIDAGDATLPVHWGEDPLDPTLKHLRAYVFVRGRRPIENPLLVDPSDALAMVVSGRKPLTVFAFLGSGSPDTEDAMRAAGRKWFADAWALHEATCDAVVASAAEDAPR